MKPFMDCFSMCTRKSHLFILSMNKWHITAGIFILYDAYKHIYHVRNQ